MVRLRNEILASVQRTGWRSVRELADGVGNPAPHRGAVVIVLRSELIRTCAAFLKRLVTVALSMSCAARQMSISGITRRALYALDR